jgi:hypothetical protein
MGGFANSYGIAQQSINDLWGSMSQGIGFWGSLLGSVGGLGASTIGPDEDGWHDYVGHPPPAGALCQFKRDDVKSWVDHNDDYSPFMNVAGLKWKLTGIARVQLEGWGV